MKKKRKSNVNSTDFTIYNEKGIIQLKNVKNKSDVNIKYFTISQ